MASVRRIRRHQRIALTPPVADLLDQIDSVVEAADSGDNPCGCGCGREIPPNGPSEYFVDANCQAIWASRQTIDPGGIYAGLEHNREFGLPLSPVGAVELARALMGEPRYLQYGVPPVEIMGFGPAVTQLLIDDPPTTGGTLELRQGFWIAGQDSPLPYRRRCRRCREVAAPVAAVRPPQVAWSFLDDGPAVSIPERAEACPCCRACHPGPLLSAQWRWLLGGGIELALLSPATGSCVQIRDDWLWGDEARLQVAQRVWSDLLQATMEQLIFTHQCAVEGCSETGRGRFQVNRPVSFLITSGVGPTEDGRAHLQPGERWLCPRHQSSLFQACDEVTLEPLLRRNLRAEQQEMSW